MDKFKTLRELETLLHYGTYVSITDLSFMKQTGVKISDLKAPMKETISVVNQVQFKNVDC